MLEFVRGKASDRKLRLFALAFVRRMYPLPDKRSKRIWATVERYVDGLADPAQLRVAWASARWAANVATRQTDDETEGVRWLLAALAEESPSWVIRGIYVPASPAERESHEAIQCRILCDLFGNPFRPVAITPAVPIWNDGTVSKLAQAIYDRRAFDRLSILADALEEAGCTDADILNHCRQPGEHVRGCWVVDLLLGKS
jgi:hypothetical protein